MRLVFERQAKTCLKKARTFCTFLFCELKLCSADLELLLPPTLFRDELLPQLFKLISLRTQLILEPGSLKARGLSQCADLTFEHIDRVPRGRIGKDKFVLKRLFLFVNPLAEWGAGGER